MVHERGPAARVGSASLGLWRQAPEHRAGDYGEPSSLEEPGAEPAEAGACTDATVHSNAETLVERKQ